MKSFALFSLLILPVAIAPTSRAADGNEIGFIEKFALAPDRDKSLADLAPGTEDFYFYHALHYQNTKNAAKLADTLEAWRKEFPTSAKRIEIENREALLAFATDPDRTLTFLKDKLNLNFDHEQEVRDQKPDLPTVLDPTKVARQAFLEKALELDNLSVTPLEMERLVRDKAQLSPAQIRNLLKQLRQPAIPGLVEMIAEDLKRSDAPAFGAIPIHNLLLPEQLSQLVALLPRLAEEPQYVRARLRKLQPGADEDAEFDPTVRQAWLDRLWAVAKDLPPSFNSTKAAILYQRLQHDRRQGVYDQARFLEYLRLPRRVGYLPDSWWSELTKTNAFWSELNVSTEETGLPFAAIGSDEALVRDYFLHFFGEEKEANGQENPPDVTGALAAYTPFVSADWLKPVFAEARIVSGRDQPERWAALLSASAFQALKDRVDIDFALQNTPFLMPGDDVAVDLYLKNVPKLIVRIYEINTLGYFTQQQRQLNTDLNLDGLVAQTEATHTYSEASFLRGRRTFPFPELKGKRGAWIIEFIGGGRSSRALIRTRPWHLTQQTGPAGDMIKVLDEKYQQVKDATVWLDGRRFTPEARTGSILIPFSAAPGRRSLVLADREGGFASLAEFEHHEETYKLNAQFYLNREQLLSGRRATLAVRAVLKTGDTLQSLALLKEVKLNITTVSLDKVSTTQVVDDVSLALDKDFLHTFTVPERLIAISATLTGKVEQLTKGGEKQELTDTREWEIAAPKNVHRGRVLKEGDSYSFEWAGSNGETLADRAVAFQFSRRGFEPSINLSLRTDDRGRIQLGAMEGLQSFLAASEGSHDPVEITHWQDSSQRPISENSIHATTGDDIEIPWTGGRAAEGYTLLERRGDEFVADRSDHVSAPADVHAPQRLTLQGLAAGDYTLFLRDEFDPIRISIARGVQVAGWVYGEKRNLELGASHPLDIDGAALEGEDLVIRLHNVNRFTRVHVAAERYIPGQTVFGALGSFSATSPAGESSWQLPNLFSAGREIGDEYRYILDRRFTKILPGNMLNRPGLLLNPWEIRTTGQTQLRQAGGQAAVATPGARPSEPIASPPAPAPPEGSSGALDPGLDFLATIAPVLYNLIPDADGVVRVPRKQLGDRQFVEIYAEDLAHAVERELALPHVETKYQDLRLARTLEPAQAFAQKDQATALQAGDKVTLADIRTSETETYDTLSSVFTLYTTLSADAELAKFSWILDWPKLSEDEKLAKYSEFACHELNFFLFRKDAAFFAKVIKPALANKKDKTFLDDYLLEVDLHKYLGPWQYGQLNAAEKALLGRRLPGETLATARHLREEWELLTPNVDEQKNLFEIALRGHALDEEKTSPAPVSEAAPAGAAAAPDPFAAPALPMKPRMSISSLQEAPTLAAKPSFASKALRVVTRSGQRASVEVEQVVALSDLDLNITDALRSSVRAYFRELGPVKEWAENNYWHLPISEQNEDLVTVNAFWKDLSAWDGRGAFLSPHFPEAHHRFAEMMLALGVLDLPFTAPKKPEPEVKGNHLAIITAAGPEILFHREILPATPAAAGQAPQILVSQSFFRQDDRYREEGNVKYEKYITNEFLTGVIYGANVVVTNPSSAPTELDLLLQIPQGSLPALASRLTDSQHLRLDPYTTKTFEYYFYFPGTPAAGATFAHYPVHATVGGVASAGAEPFVFHVVNKLTEVNKASWDYVSQYGTGAEVLAYLEQNNLQRIDLGRIAWRCRAEAGFFHQVIAFLEHLHHFDPVLYSYAIPHKDAAVLAEFLLHQDELVKNCGSWLDSPLLRIDPVERRDYQHLEYAPLVNPRAHRVGDVRHITTPEQLTQYESLLDILAHKPALEPMDQISVVYHLFLQDRIEEALERFHSVRPEALPTKLQYDYFHCYADFYEGQLAEARGIASQHVNEPVNRWRELFVEVISQLDEIEGKGGKDALKPDREKAQAALASSEPSFDFKVENRTMKLEWKNLSELTLSYYLLDPEFAFSSSPFASQGADRSSILKPNQRMKLPLPADRNAWETPLPAEYAKANVFIEILGAGQRKTASFHANTLKLDLTENYGRLEVRDQASNQPLPKTYVKAYARLKDGTVRFFKDGYTDLRGRFDYASLNSPAGVPVVSSDGGSPANGLDYQPLKPGELGLVEKIAILVLSDSNGAEVREVNPPSQ